MNGRGGDFRFPLRNVVFSGVRLVANQLLPLVALPFCLSKLGPELFGNIMLAQAVAWYFYVFVEYGFNLTAVRFVSINKDNKEKIGEFLFSVTFTRWILFVVSISTAIICFVILYNHEYNIVILLIAMLLPLGGALQPIWFFQGIEKFGLISLIQVLSRLACFGLIFIVVKSEDDVYWAQALMCSPFLVNALILLPIAIKKYGFYNKIKLSELFGSSRVILKEGFDVFISQLATTLFSSTTTVLAGFILGASSAGYYSMAEKIIRGIAMLTTPVTEAIYPKLASALSDNKDKFNDSALSFIRKCLFYGVVVLAIVAVVLAILSDFIAEIISSHGQGSREIALTLLILSPVPLSIYINNIFGVQILVNVGLGKMYRNCVIYSGLMIPILGFILPHLMGFIGFPVALLFGELMLAFLTFILFKKYVKTGANK